MSSYLPGIYMWVKCLQEQDTTEKCIPHEDIVPLHYEEPYGTRTQNGKNGRRIQLQSRRSQYFASHREEAICLVILSEPQSKCEPNDSLSMHLVGPGYQPGHPTSTENLPSLATSRKTCFHCSKSLLRRIMEIPTTFRTTERLIE